MHLLGLGDLYDDLEDGPSKVLGRLSRGTALWGVCAVERVWGRISVEIVRRVDADREACFGAGSWTRDRPRLGAHDDMTN